jgi:hypothetical protein
MLGMSTFELGNPMVLHVAMEAGDAPFGRAHILVCAHVTQIAEKKKAPP